MIAASFVSLFEVHLLTTISCISCFLATYSATTLSQKKRKKTSASNFSNLFLIAEISMQQNKKSFTFQQLCPFYLQSTGTFFATARYGSATPVPPSVISRGAGWLVCLCDISFTYCDSFLHFRPKIYCFITWENLFDFQGIGVLLNGMFGSVTGASASVYL